MILMDLLRGLLRRGIRIGYASKPAFRPEYQDRTDAMEDIVKNKEARDGTKVGTG